MGVKSINLLYISYSMNNK